MYILLFLKELDWFYGCFTMFIFCNLIFVPVRFCSKVHNGLFNGRFHSDNILNEV